MDSQSLVHSKWNCKYHIVFAPKYRRTVIYGKIKVEDLREEIERCISYGEVDDKASSQLSKARKKIIILEDKIKAN
jgi:dsDNA-specific endonuclease/ATPase MutS2